MRNLLGRLALIIFLAHASISNSSTADAGSSTRVDSLLKEMTIEEKVGQLNLRFLNLHQDISDDDVRAGRIGGFLYSSDLGYTNYLQRIAFEQSRLHIPLLFGLDVISGYRTIFPAPIALASSWDTDLILKTRAVAAREARAAGINWAYAPMVDIARDPRWGRIVEGAGEDPFLGAAVARAQVLGLQGDSANQYAPMMACAKHFAAYGAVEGGRDYASVSVPENTLQNVYFPPFRAAVEAGVGCIMSAYIDLNDLPATGNAWLIKDVLRNQFKFQGIVVSDAFSIRTLTTHGLAQDIRAASLLAAQAGINVDMEGNVYAANLGEDVRRGRIKESELDDLVRPVLVAKERLGLFDNPYTDQAAMEGVLSDPESRRLARTAAQRSTVLLKNERNLLPLKLQDWKSIAVVGPFADSQQDLLGPWSTTANYHETVSILKGLKKHVKGRIKIGYAQGVQIERAYPSEFDVYYTAPVQDRWSNEKTKAEFTNAVELAQQAELTILVLGESYNMAGENASRASLRLPGLQQDLLEHVVALGKPVVLVLVTGRPLDITWANDHARAILLPWYPGTAGGDAIADIIFGKANPGAKLPISWPRSVGQIPVYYSHNSTMAPHFAGRRYWDEPSDPLYQFGFGLGYSTFSLRNLRLNTKTLEEEATLSVSVDVSNEGSQAGDEVVQLYVGQRYGTASRPVRELKGFQRLTLAPGKHETIKFKLNMADLRYWSSRDKTWLVDNTVFDIWVGNSSLAAMTGSFTVVHQP